MFRAFITTLFLTLISVAAHAVTECEYDLNPQLVSAQTEQFRIGMLLRAPSGEYYFGMAPYMGFGHRRLWEQLKDAAGEGTVIEWAGEIELHPTAFGLRAIHINETSGFAKRFLEANPDRGRNVVRTLWRTLAQFYPAFMEPDVQLETYNKLHEHLAGPELLVDREALHDLGQDVSGLDMALAGAMSTLERTGKLESFSKFVPSVEIIIRAVRELINSGYWKDRDLLRLKSLGNVLSTVNSEWKPSQFEIAVLRRELKWLLSLSPPVNNARVLVKRLGN
jgi:hypothetical protein